MRAHQRKFEVGQAVSVRGMVSEIMQCNGETLLSVAIKSDCLSQLKYHIGMKPCSVLLAPSKDEYALSLRELSDLVDWYANSETMCRISPALYKERFGDMSTYDKVMLWLKGRGKEEA